MVRYMIAGGAGRVGRAVAYDLLKNKYDVTLVDGNEPALDDTAKWLNSFGFEVKIHHSHVPTDHLDNVDCCVSCLPYFMNLNLCKICLDRKIHYIDHGGNTDIVEQQLKLNNKGSVCIVDSGLAPGLNLVLSKFLVDVLGSDSVKMYCGGLHKKVPNNCWKYSLLFSSYGLIGEYRLNSNIIRDGVHIKVPALSELENITVDDKEYECFATSGGVSRFHKDYNLKNLEYKTIRYKGHREALQPLIELGFFKDERLDRFTYMDDILSERFDLVMKPETKEDFVILRAVGGSGEDQTTMDVYCEYDEKTGLSAMEQSTGFSTTTALALLEEGLISDGNYTLYNAINYYDVYFNKLCERGIDVKLKIHKQTLA